MCKLWPCTTRSVFFLQLHPRRLHNIATLSSSVPLIFFKMHLHRISRPQEMSLFTASQDGPGELDKDLLPAAPIVASYDENAKLTAPDTRGGGASLAAPDDDAGDREIEELDAWYNTLLQETTTALPGSFRADAPRKVIGEPAHRHPIATRGGGASFAVPDDDAGDREIAALDASYNALLQDDFLCPGCENVHCGGCMTPPREEPAVEPLHDTTGRKTKWGRCPSCLAPLQVVYTGGARNAPYLGCTKFRYRDKSSCGFTAIFPSHRLNQLPAHVIGSRSVLY